MHCRAIYFDAVGTLIHPEPAPHLVYAQSGRRHGSRLPAAEIRARFRRAFRRQEEADRAAGWRTSETREIERWRTIVAEVLDDVRDTAACFAELYEHFARPDAWCCDPGAAPVLAELSRRGCSLGIASNYDSRLRRVLAGLPMLDYIKQVLISSEVGWRKPAPEFFAAMVRQAGAAPEETLYVGDDYENDYRAAMSAGLHALLLGPPRDRARHIARIGDLLRALG